MSASGPLKQVLYWILRTSETTSGGVCSAYAAHWVRQVIQSRMCIDLLRIVTIGMHLLGIKVAVNNVCFCVMCVCVCESERERERDAGWLKSIGVNWRSNHPWTTDGRLKFKNCRTWVFVFWESPTEGVARGDFKVPCVIWCLLDVWAWL